MNIGLAIKEARKREGMSRYDLSEKIQIKEKGLSDIENGYVIPNNYAINKICSVLNVPVPFIYVLAMEQTDVPNNKQEDYKIMYPYIKDIIIRLLS